MAKVNIKHLKPENAFVVSGFFWGGGGGRNGAGKRKNSKNFLKALI